MKNFIAILLLMAGMFACKTQDRTVRTETTDTETKVTGRVVPAVHPNDSLYLSALFRCDSAGKVVMEQLLEYKSKSNKSIYNFIDGKLLYKNITVHDTIWIPCTDTVTTTIKTITITPPPIVIKEPVAWWIQVLAWLGAAAILLTTVLTIQHYRRPWKRK